MKILIVLLFTCLLSIQANARLLSEAMRIAPFELKISAQDDLKIVDIEIGGGVVRKDVFGTFGSAGSSTYPGPYLKGVTIEIAKDGKSAVIRSKRKIVNRIGKKIFTVFDNCSMNAKFTVADPDGKVIERSLNLVRSNLKHICSNSKDMRDLLLSNGDELNLHYDIPNGRWAYLYLKP